MHPADRYASLLEEPEVFREACNRPLPTVVRVNTLRATPSRVRRSLGEAGLASQQRAWQPTVFELETDRPGRTWPYVHGWIHGQEEISQLPPLVLGPEPGDVVWDAAAAPGGKATQLAAIQEDQGLVIANDVNLGRLAPLRSNAERLGVTNLIVTHQDARTFSTAGLPVEDVDHALVDAPCSGEGTVRKNPSVLETWREEGLDELTALQTEILRRAVQLVRPGGTVIYSTCTFAPEENERVLDRVLATEPCEIERFETHLAHRPGIERWRDETYDPAVVRAKRFYPHLSDTGGFFIAKLRVRP